MAANATALRGLCPAPFFDESNFADTGYGVENRMCKGFSDTMPGVSCCLPCPVTDMLYPPSFRSWDRAAGYINIVTLSSSVFLLLSFIVLPVDVTKRHYLNICLLVATTFVALGFLMPLAIKPAECADLITPHDMHTDLTCAWSGSFLLGGGLIANVWIFVRALSMHLQIVWDVIPGRKFFLSSQILGWGVTVVIFSIAMSLTGVSYRFGSSCHLNDTNSLASCWIYMVLFAGASSVLQFWSFGYCIYVYLQNLNNGESSGTNSTGLPSFIGRSRKDTTRAVYRRVSQVFRMHWRSNFLTVIILADVIYFATVFLYIEARLEQVKEDPELLEEWVLCLVLSGGESERCHKEAGSVTVPMAVIAGLLVLFSIAGIQIFIMLARRDMFRAWWDLGKSLFVRRREFVSLDAKPSSALPTFEMLKVGTTPANSVTKPSPTVSVPASPKFHQASKSPSPASIVERASFTDYLTPTQRPFSGMKLNFSDQSQPGYVSPPAPTEVPARPISQISEVEEEDFPDIGNDWPLR